MLIASQPGEKLNALSKQESKEKLLTKDQLVRVMGFVGLQMTLQLANECLFFATQGSFKIENYSLDLMVDWLCRNIPCMRSNDYYQRLVAKGSEASLESLDDARSQTE